DGDERRAFDRGKHQHAGGVAGAVDLFLGDELDPHAVLVGPRVFVAAVNVNGDGAGERAAFRILAAQLELVEARTFRGEEELRAAAAAEGQRGGGEFLAARFVAHGA